jgi:acyl-coenzyme A synthetase/AMP-(fatty) acid ligase
MKMNYSRMLRSLALRFRNQEAIVNVERNRRYSYWDYHLLTNRIANALRTSLGIGNGDRFMLILENDNLSLMMLPCTVKQEGTVVLTNLRDAREEHARQIALVEPKVVFIETALLDNYHDMLRGHGCQIVAMDALIVPRDGVVAFWDLVEAAPDTENDIELCRKAKPEKSTFAAPPSSRAIFAMRPQPKRSSRQAPGVPAISAMSMRTDISTLSIA